MMSNEQILKLARTASGYDGRRPPNEQAKTAWFEGARRGRWSFAEAEAAIHEHYADDTTWIMPAHVSAIIRKHRAERSHAEFEAAERARAAGQPGPGGPRTPGRDLAMQVVAQLTSRLGIDRDPRHDEARKRVRCPRCRAQPGETCVNPQTGRPLRDSPGHDARLEALEAAGFGVESYE
jgi:hypothetical protein